MTTITHLSATDRWRTLSARESARSTLCGCFLSSRDEYIERYGDRSPDLDDAAGNS
jgi:hypothetical protein